MTRARDVIPPPSRRLLSAAEAAAYCGAPSIAKWRAACPVTAVRIYDGNDGLRYDRARLDAWIETVAHQPVGDEDIGGALDRGEQKRRTGRRHQAVSQRG